MMPAEHFGRCDFPVFMREIGAGLWRWPGSNVRFAEFYLQTTVQQEIRNLLDWVKCRVLIRAVTGSKPVNILRPRAYGLSCPD